MAHCAGQGALRVRNRMRKRKAACTKTNDSDGVCSCLVSWLCVSARTCQRLSVRLERGAPRASNHLVWEAEVGGDKHSGDDDKQTDHVGKGSDGHTVESGDDK